MTKRAQVVERPELYDWLYEDETQDIPMYFSLAQHHHEVLECGVGTGRIAIPMAESGIAVYGIDNSDDMLRRLNRKLENYSQAVQSRLRVLKADMRDFSLGRNFSFIYVPFSTFNYLLTIEDQRASLAAIRRHLAPHGTLVLELLSFSFSPGWLDNQPTMSKVKERYDPTTGRTMEMWKVGTFDCTTQRVTEDRYFRFYDAAGSLEREEVVFWENRFFFISELLILLEEIGLQVSAVYGDYEFGPYRHESPFVVVVAQHRD